MRRLISLVILTTATVGGSLMALPAQAAEPQRSTFSINDQFTVEGGCPFPVELHFVGSGRDTVFLDGQGNVLTVRTHLDVFATFTNTTNGVSISGPAHINEWFDPTANTLTVDGLVHQFTVPGVGLVFIDTGRLVIDLTTGTALFEAGPHQDWDGDIAGLCAALT